MEDKLRMRVEGDHVLSSCVHVSSLHVMPIKNHACSLSFLFTKTTNLILSNLD